MTFTFNLVDCKWIPCIHHDGQVEDFSLREALTSAHELRGIQGDSPLETAALYRLLLAVLHSALRGPRTLSAWAKLWDAGFWVPQLVNNYLDRWRNRFDLFDPDHPFYQAADERVKPKSIITLALDMASGNNGVLFDHHTEVEGEALSPAKAARTLIAMQGFGLAGLSGLEQNFTDAPWGRGVIFFVESDNLFRTLALNLLLYPDENIIPSRPEDCPAWEQDNPHLPARQIPVGYLDYLTWQNRRILLIPEDHDNSIIVRSMTMAPGLRLDSSVLDPMKLYRAGKEEGYISTRYSEERVLWRDSASLFALKGTHGNFPPKTFFMLANLATQGYIPHQQAYRFMGLGMANNQAKVDFFREEHLPLPLGYLESEVLVEQLASALELTEKVRFALRISGQRMALLVVSPKSDGKKWPEVDRISKDQAEKLLIHWNVERFYWQQLEIPFLRFLEDLPNDPGVLQTWKDTVRRTAWDALEQAAVDAGTDAAALKAAVRARGMLGYLLKELYPETKEEEPA